MPRPLIRPPSYGRSQSAASSECYYADDAARSTALAAARQDPSPLVRAAAVLGLTPKDLADPGLGIALRTWAVTEEAGVVRAAALDRLHWNHTHEHANIATFGNRAHTDPDPQVRTTALTALVTDWTDEPNVRELTEALAHADPDPASRQAAQQLLADTWGSNPEAAPSANTSTRWPTHVTDREAVAMTRRG